MIELIIEIFRGIGWISFLAAILYYIPYLVRKGWGDAENRTKKVCDVCFRDIDKFNEAYKKITKGEE